MVVKSRGIPFQARFIPMLLSEPPKKTVSRRTWGLEFINRDPGAFEFVRMEGDLAEFQVLRNTYIKLFYSRSPKYPLPKKSELVGNYIHLYIKCPYGAVGDELYLKETFWQARIVAWSGNREIYGWTDTLPIKYQGDIIPSNGYYKKRPSIHMPKWASRKSFVIKELGPERLQGITDEEAIKEGCNANYIVDTITLARAEFWLLWNSINAKRGYPWYMNPYVWRIGW